MTKQEILKQRERMAELATEARTVLDSITDKTPEGEAKDIEARFDAMMADHDKIAAKVERGEKLLAAEAKAFAEAEEERDTEAPVEIAYRDVFDKAIRFGVSALNQDERAALMANRVDLPAEMRAQSTTDAAGGYTVPTEFSGEIDAAMAAWGPMWDAAVCRELVTGTGARINWPTTDDTANTGRIKAENSSVDDDGTDDVVFGNKELDAYVYDTGMLRVSMELLQDSEFNLEQLMQELFAERLGRTANTALTTGTGSAQPNGVVTASSKGVDAAVGSFTADNLIALVHSVDPAYRSSPQCRWMFNDSTLAEIRKLKDGQNNYLWQMGDVRIGEPATLLGHPYSVNQAMADIGASAKSILFGDFSKYVVRKVAGFQTLALRERYAENFQVGMVGFKRFDGELLNTAAIKHVLHAAS